VGSWSIPTVAFFLRSSVRAIGPHGCRRKSFRPTGCPGEPVRIFRVLALITLSAAQGIVRPLARGIAKRRAGRASADDGDRCSAAPGGTRERRSK